MVQGEEYRLLRMQIWLMREIQPQFPQDTLYPSNCGKFRWNLVRASPRLESPVRQVIALPDADDEVRGLPGTFARIRIGARHLLTQAEFTIFVQMQAALRESDSHEDAGSQEDACIRPNELRYLRVPFDMFWEAYGYAEHVGCSSAYVRQFQEFYGRELRTTLTYRDLVGRGASEEVIFQTL